MSDATNEIADVQTHLVLKGINYASQNECEWTDARVAGTQLFRCVPAMSHAVTSTPLPTKGKGAAVKCP